MAFHPRMGPGVAATGGSCRGGAPSPGSRERRGPEPQQSLFPVTDILKVADRWLAARVAEARGDSAEWWPPLGRPWRPRMRFPYMEPSYWLFPVRPAFGAAPVAIGAECSGGGCWGGTSPVLEAWRHAEAFRIWRGTEIWIVGLCAAALTLGCSSIPCSGRSLIVRVPSCDFLLHHGFRWISAAAALAVLVAILPTRGADSAAGVLFSVTSGVSPTWK